MERETVALNTPSRRAELATWAAFATLCLGSGSDWILSAAMDRMLPGLVGLAVRQAALALVFGVLAMRDVRRLQLRVCLQLAGWGAGLFGVLPVLFAVAGGRVSSLTELLVLALIPAAVVFLDVERSAGFGRDESSFALLLPALAGVGGLGMIVEFAVPTSAAGIACFLAMVAGSVLSGWALLRLSAMLSGPASARIPLAAGAACVCAGTCVAAAAFAWAEPGTMPAWDATALWQTGVSAAAEGTLLLLALFALRGLGPIRFSTRYVLVPLIAVMESFLLMRPRLGWTATAGFVLAIFSVWTLLRFDAPARIRP